jgi:hypothetical protein
MQSKRVGIAVENRPLTVKSVLGQDKRGPTTPTGEKISTADAANDEGPSPCDEGPSGGCHLGWLMGLEPTTTRITIWDSTN